MNAKLPERDAFKFAIGRMILDRLHVAAIAVALMQHGRMSIRETGAAVELIAGKATKSVEMRRHMCDQLCRQMNVQKVLQGLIRAIEIEPGRVGGDSVCGWLGLHGLARSSLRLSLGSGSAIAESMPSDLDTVPLRPLDVSVGGLRFRLLAAQDHDALLAATAAGRHLPFGLILWESAVALAEALLARGSTLAGRTVLELGAGLGLPGMVAARHAAAVVQTDHDPLALQVCARNAELNGLTSRLTFQIADWRAWDDATRYDIVIGADILYDRDDHADIARTLAATLAPGGIALLSDPMRPDTPTFIERLRADGWSIKTDIVAVADLTRADRQVQVMVVAAQRH